MNHKVVSRKNTRQHFYRHIAPQVWICTNQCKWSNALHEIHIEVLDTKLALMFFNCRNLYNAATWHKKCISYNIAYTKYIYCISQNTNTYYSEKCVKQRLYTLMRYKACRAKMFCSKIRCT